MEEEPKRTENDFRWFVEFLMHGGLGVVGLRLVSYLFAAEWYPMLGVGTIPPIYVRIPVAVTLGILASYWILLYRSDYRYVKEDSFFGLLLIALSWLVIFLSSSG